MSVEPPPRGRKKVVILFAVIGAVVVVAATVGFLLVRTANDANRAKDATAVFFTELEQGRFDQAYQRLCPATQEKYPKDRFESELNARPPAGHEMTGELRVNGTPSGTTATVGVKLRYADGASDARLVPLERRDDEWRICGSPF
jgi:Domain of unknown function (DUF4878)